MKAIAYLVAVLPFYLLGAFPTGHLLARRKGINLADHGSGNIGATNVARVLGKRQGLITLAADVFKGFLAPYAAHIMAGDPSFTALAAAAVAAGHCFSIPGKLRGGKGVATALGVTLFVDPLLAAAALAVFAAVFGYYKIVSVASVSATLVVPIMGFFLGVGEQLQLALVAIALLVVYRHRENLARLSRGEEPVAAHRSKT